MDKTVRAVRALALCAGGWLFFMLCPFPLLADEDERVVLNADRVSYNDETGQASAQGSAVLTYRGLKIEAERIDYDAGTQKVEAMPLPKEKVRLSGSGRTLLGDHLDYDLVTREGVFSGARTSLAAGAGTLYVYGGEIDVLPWDTAVERGLVSGQKGRPEDYVAQWRNVVLTTCAMEHPHYRLESKSISFIPGRLVTAKKPRLYLGNTYIFTFPMDYIVQLQRRALKYSLVPYLQRSSSRGAGGGVNGTLGWDTGSLSVGVAWADRIGFEGMFELEQELSPEFSVLAGVKYTWDEAWDETIWRPYVALTFARNDWTVRLGWSRDEYIEDQKDSLYEYQGRLDRRAELNIQSPWFVTSPWSWMNVLASWGSYNEKIHGQGENAAQRYGVELRNYFERSFHPNAEFFLDTIGNLWFYDKTPSDQESLWFMGGLRYRWGSVELGTGYERRYIWGDGPMLWDRYRTRERIHQKIRFPLGREIYAAARGSYDLDQSMIDQVTYSLQWAVDCMVWDLHFKDDRTSGGNNQIGLSLMLLAFPDTPASLGQKLDRDPFERPRNLPKK
ncbi:MAG: hypothetical protein IJU98_08835 [Synergistaceae bacterium]|nr:hypothetical protein [Synergistaceae bacterium]